MHSIICQGLFLEQDNDPERLDSEVLYSLHTDWTTWKLKQS